MIRSHYIPQFILRNFCEDVQITYCDLDNKEMQLRNPRSVFSEVGYYPDTLEKDLSKKAESLFANLYHNKLENARNSVVLSADELFILKKYLIVSSIRYRYEHTKEEAVMIEQLGNAYKPQFIEELNYVLACDSAEKMMDYVAKATGILDLSKMDKWGENTDVNFHLWSEIKDILHSYIIFVRTRTDEEFLIPDTGKGIYEGPMSRRKMYGLLDVAMAQKNPSLLQIAFMLTPHDYTVFPLSKNLAVLSMSTFFKLLTDSEVTMNVKLPEDCPTVSSVLGFGSRDMITPPKVKNNRGVKEYRYDVKQLSSADVSHFNSLMLADAKHHIAYSNRSHLKKTMNIVSEYTDRDVSFMNV